MKWSIGDDHMLSGTPEVNKEFDAHTKINRHKKSVKMPDFDLKRLDTIIIHYTAGGSGRSSADWLSREEVAASAHLVIDRSGQVFQLLPFNKKSWHAGPSSLGERSNFNNFSIGIELDNAGILQKIGNRYQSSFSREYDESEVLKATHQNENNSKYWHKYTPAQIEACELICVLLISKYGLKYIYGHDEIAVGRKTDPGPAFAMDAFRNRLLNTDREDSEDFEPFNGFVSANSLNIRKGPGTQNPLVAMPLEQAQQVEVVGAHADWLEVKTTISGWVSAKYIQKKA